MLNWIKQLFPTGTSSRHSFGDVLFEGEEGFVDLAIPVLKVSNFASGLVSICAIGNTAAGDVGFNIEVLPEWREQDVDDGRLTLYWGAVRYRSTGAASGRFLDLLAKQYGDPAMNLRMKDVVEFTAVGINSDPRQLKTSRVDMKLFLDQGPEETYAEVYTNLDVKNKRIEFREKDFDYRVPLISGLSV